MMKLINRRVALRSLVVSLGAVSFGRVIAACTAPAANSDELKNSDGDKPGNETGNKNPTPTDADEHVPGKSAPVDTGDAPKIPVQSWESRVKQLEAEQQRQYSRPAFARGDAGIWLGKENAHEPRVGLVKEGDVVRIEVVVEHVMGANLIDAGPATPAPKPDATAPIPEAGAPNEAGARDAGTDAATPNAPNAPPATPAQIHYITTIYLRANIDGADRVVGLWEFNSGDAAPPTVRFTLPPGVKEVVAYEWCTLHGLWKAQPLAIPAAV